MSVHSKNSFCGNPGINLGSMRIHNQEGNISSLLGDKNYFYVHKTRTAIKYTCSLLGLNSGCEILLPAYNCGSEIDPLIKSGVSIIPYRIDKKTGIDISYLISHISSRTKAIYITHYFGFSQKTQEIAAVCKERGLYLIEDCAHSLFSSCEDINMGNIGDIALFNFPKTLPVPDGGLIVVNNENLFEDRWDRIKPKNKDILKKTLPILKSSFLSWASHYPFYPYIWKSFKLIINEPCRDLKDQRLPDMPNSYYFEDRMNNCDISFVTRRMIDLFDINKIKERRRLNYNMLLDSISENSEIQVLFKNLPDGICPLCFPMIIPNRNRREICNNLLKKGIMAVAWWAGYHKYFPWQNFPDACFLKDNIICVPNHQDLRDNDIYYIVDSIRETIN